MNLTEKAAYLQGLAEGLGVDDATKEGKVIKELLTLVSDMADKLEAVDGELTELRDYIEEVDEDLGSVEEDLYGDDEDADEDEEDDGDDGDGYYEMVCPSCGETICFDESLDTDELVCPACGEKITDIEICDGKCDTCEDEDCDAKQEFFRIREMAPECEFPVLFM